MASVIWIENERRWSLRVSIAGHVRRFTSTRPGIAGKKECLRKYREYIDGHAAEQITVADAWQKFLAHIVDKNGRTDAYINLDKYGRNYILPRIGKMLVSNVSVVDLQEIISNARPVSDRVEMLSRKTLSNLRASIMQFVRYCIAAEYMDPLRGELYIPKTAPRKNKVILQPDAIRRLFAPSSAEDWYINIFRFGCVTGLRTGEILGIKTTDIQNGVLTISRSINNRNEITDCKNDNARRQIYLNTIARRIINENIVRNRPLRTDWIFCAKNGGPLSQSTLRNAWLRLASERDLPGSPYSLRHTFISLFKNEMPEAMLRQIVGHGANMDTIGIYGHIVNGELEQAARIIDVNFEKLANGSK